MTALKQIRAALDGLKSRVLAHDAKLNGTAPKFEDSAAPTGDDYNTIYGETVSTLAAIESIATPETGRLWWNADDPAELVRELARLTEKGAVIVSVMPAPTDAPASIGYVFELEKARAAEILGHVPDADEWMTE
ncbi:hypothetical protein D3C87_1203770 [compost metagenome]